MILFIWLFAILPIGYLLLKVIFGLIAHTASGVNVNMLLIGCRILVVVYFLIYCIMFSMDFSCNSGERGE